MKDYGADNQLIIKQRYNREVFGPICLNPDERKKDRNIVQSLSPIALFHNLIFIDTGD